MAKYGKNYQQAAKLVDRTKAYHPQEAILLENSKAGQGKWELSSSAPCIVAGTAVVAIKGKEKAAEFSLDYDWLMEEIKQHPEANEYKMTKLSPVTLAVALNENKWEELGQLREITKVVDIGNEVKRCYKASPKNGQELLEKQYQSVPWDISLLAKLT